MEDTSQENIFFSFLRKNKIIILFGLAGLILFGYGLIVFLGQNSEQQGVTFIPNKEQDDSIKQSDIAGATTYQNEIVVDIQGAVMHPGVYSLGKDARVKDVLTLAGGLSQESDRDYVAKKVNLAARLTDGLKIYIPSIGEEVASINLPGSLDSSDGKINLNTASQSELESLPGVGPVTAEKIASMRPYSTVDELLSRKAVTSRVFDQIKEKVTTF